MKRIFASLLLLLSACQSYSQSRVIDSLNKLIANAKSDTARINISIKKIGSLTEVNIDSAIAFGLATIEESKRIKYLKGEADSRIRTAGAYDFKGDWKAAEENIMKAGELYKLLKDSAGRGNFYSAYGMMLSMQGRYDTAIIHMQKAISIGEELNDTKLLSNVYGNIAIAFYMKSNFSQALFYQQKELRIAEATKDINSQAYVAVNMALTYKSMGDTTRAEEFLLKAVSLGRQVGAKNIELYAYSNLSTIYESKNLTEKSYEFAMKAATLGGEMGDQGIQSASLGKAATCLAQMGQFEKAEALAKRSIEIADSSNQPFNIYQTYASMGSVFKIEGKCKEAIAYFEKALHAMKDADIFDEQFGHSYGSLAECYEKTGDFGKALSNFKMASQIIDSMHNRENIRKATELNMNYEFDKKQEVARAEQQKEKAVVRARQLALIIGLVLTLALAAIAFTAFRNKQRANKLLSRQKEEIQSTLTELKSTQLQLIQSEKMASLGELTAGIAHEIENPLNFVNNFSEVNTELIAELKNELKSGNKEEALLLVNDIEGNEHKIIHHGKRADAIVKGMLQHSRINSGMKELTDINVLANEYLRLSYHSQRAKDKSFQAILQTHLEPNLGKVRVVPQEIGRVLLNIYTNALYYLSEKKNQSPPGYEPTLITHTKRLENSVEIRITDNGPGISEKATDKIFQPFFTTKPTGSGTGLGLSLSYDIIKAHGGEIKVESVPGKGATFIIHLPTHD